MNHVAGENSRNAALEFACHQTLRTSKYEEHKGRNPDPVEGTCKWILGHNTFTTWRTLMSGFIWISADLSCGKSVLSKFLVDNELKSNESRTTCYFFFKSGGDADQRSVDNALCALLHQLFSQRPSLIKYAIPDFKANGPQLPTLFNALWSILLTAASDEQCGETVCILDGLDVLRQPDCERLCLKLTQFYGRTPSHRSSTLKFIVTSRPYLTLERSFAEITHLVPSIRLAGEKEYTFISREINLVIEYRCRVLAVKMSWNTSLHIYFINRLLSIPHRTYLWLYLIFEVIEHHLRPSTEEVLEGKSGRIW